MRGVFHPRELREQRTWRGADAAPAGGGYGIPLRIKAPITSMRIETEVTAHA